MVRWRSSASTVDPDQMGGVHSIRDLRVTVAMVLGQLAGGRTLDEVLAEYPYLEHADVLAALEYASVVVNEREVPGARADRADIHVTQIRRYEAGTSAPTLDALRNLAIALNITTDSLVFDPTARGPSDDLALHLEAIEQLDPDDQHTVRSLIEAILLRHDTRRWTQAS
jgi:uncharacterized protein (DUF433 family)/transcriptional regulator with XRE-family HTH domain